MWEKLSANSIIFNKNFYNSNNFYLNSSFIKSLYFYYISGGYYNILITHVSNILISNFIIWFILFLINVVDYRKIITLSDYIFLNELFNWDNYLNLNYFMWIMVIIFMIYTFIKILNLIDNSVKFYEIKKFYNKTLGISDTHLEFLEWEKIIHKISKSQPQKLDLCLVNSIITMKDNYIVALFDEDIITITHLSNLMEWNIFYCIVLKILHHYRQNTINDKEFDDKTNNLIEDIEILTKTISIINFIFMPFVLTIMLFYTIFSYGEQFYNNPTLLGTRIFTRIAHWKLKNYNELSFDYQKRLNSVEKLSSEYIKLFPNSIMNEISKFLIFILSSFFIIIVILSLINDKILLYVLITKNQSLLWLIGILGSLIALFKVKNKKKENPIKIMDKITDKIFIEKDFTKYSYKNKNYNKFCFLYQYKIVYLIKEIFYTLLVPFHLWIISYNIESIVEYVNGITEPDDEILYINKNANFISLMNQKIADNNVNLENTNMVNQNQRKSNLSFINFKKNHPEWEKSRMKKIFNMDDSVQINII